MFPIRPGRRRGRLRAGCPDDGRLLWSKTIRHEIRFPYITSFLTFRELPILLELLDEVRAAGQLAPLLLVDGSGILHPHAPRHRRAISAWLPTCPRSA